MCALPQGYMAGGSAPFNTWHCCQQLTVQKGLMMSQEKLKLRCFFVYFCGKYAEFKKLQFFRFNQKQCLFLTHSVLYFFEKFTLTNKKKSDFEQSYYKKGRIQSQNLDFLKVHSILLKKPFSEKSTHVSSWHGALPRTTAGCAVIGLQGLTS